MSWKIVKRIQCVAVSLALSVSGLSAWAGSMEVEGESQADVQLFVDDASPGTGSGLGKVEFHGNNDATEPEKVKYASIETEVSNATDGAESAKLVVRTQVNGTGTDIVEIDGSGLSVETGGLNVTGAATVGGALGVTGGVTAGDVTAIGAVSGASVSASDDSYVGDDLTVAGDASVSANLSVTGAVGIGTSPPYRALDVQVDYNNKGAAYFYNGKSSHDAVDYGLQIRCGTTASNTTDVRKHIIFYEGNGYELGSIGGSGWDINTINFSDERLKEDIRPSRHDSLSIIRNLPVRDFKWRATRGRPESERPVRTGFIAQELEEVYPEAVVETLRTNVNYIPTTVTLEAGTVYEGRVLKEATQVVRMEKEPEETYKAIMPMKLIPVLVGAVQEQQKSIEAVQADMEALSETAKVASEKALAAATQALAQPGAEISDELVQQIVDVVFVELGVDRWVEIPLAEAWEEVDEMRERRVLKAVTEHRMNWDTMAVEAVEVTRTVTESEPTGKKVRRFKAGVRFDKTDGKFYKRVFLDDPDLSSVERSLVRRQVAETLRRAFHPRKTSEAHE